jgi:hypothetical protein
MDTATSCLQRVTAPHGEPLEGVELRLHGSGTIEGRVVNASGQGLSGVGVHTAGNLSGATTDATGSFTLKGLPSDIYDIIIQPKAIPGNVLYLGEQVQGVSSGRKDLIVVLEVATILRGKFVDANDRPIGHGSVIGRVPGRSREFTSYTSADGSFSIPVPVDVSLGLEGFRSPPTEVPDHPMTDENIARAHVLTSSDTEVILRLPR